MSIGSGGYRNAVFARFIDEYQRDTGRSIGIPDNMFNIDAILNKSTQSLFSKHILAETGDENDLTAGASGADRHLDHADREHVDGIGPRGGPRRVQDRVRRWDPLCVLRPLRERAMP